jgi:predicted SnoaL-like aldol condensation-catalyzing enzyme
MIGTSEDETDYMLETSAQGMGPQNHKEIVADFFRLIWEGRPKNGLRFFSSSCVQHNPYVHGGMEALLDSMATVQKEQSSQFSQPSILLRHVLEQGDIVMAHTQILFSKTDPNKGGLRQVHIFRFGNDNKVAEYWDITQVIQPDMPHAANAF